MKKILLSISLMSMCALQAVAQFAAPPAFPGAEGYGRYVTGARQDGLVEPDVYHVTTLEDDNRSGSLRYAVEKSGQRIIIFDVSGTINLNKALSITKDDITILGQTAPGDGICIANYPVKISANNVIIRYLRFRLFPNVA
jgi:pectate lyase